MEEGDDVTRMGVTQGEIVAGTVFGVVMLIVS